MRRLKNTEISDEQQRWHEENKIETSEDEIQLDEDGKPALVYLAHGVAIPRDEETLGKLLNSLGEKVAEIRAHYPPPPPKNDKRFQEDFGKDKERCEKLGYQLVSTIWVLDGKL